MALLSRIIMLPLYAAISTDPLLFRTSNFEGCLDAGSIVRLRARVAMPCEVETTTPPRVRLTALPSNLTAEFAITTTEEPGAVILAKEFLVVRTSSPVKMAEECGLPVPLSNVAP